MTSFTCPPSTILSLGSILSSKKVAPSDDISSRIAKASKAFGGLSKRLWRRFDISLPTKLKIFNAGIVPILVYGSESWCPLKTDIDSLEIFQMYCLRTMCRLSLLDRVSNTEVRQRCGNQPRVEELIRRNRMRWLGHVARMPDERICKRVWTDRVPHGWKCTRNAPKKTWSKLVLEDMTPKLRPAYGAHWSRNPTTIICDIAADRGQWRRTFVMGNPTALP